MAKKTVLIADDDLELVRFLTACAQELGLHVRTASDGLDVLLLALKQPPHLLILDINMPVVDGCTVCEMLAEDHKIPPFPVITLTGRTDHETIRRCVISGAHYVPKGVDMWDKLKPVICRYLEIESEATAVSNVAISAKDQTPAAPSSPRILVVDDDLDLCKAIEVRLKSYGFDVIRAQNGKQGYWMALKEKPDLIITDLTMPELSGEALIRKLVFNAETQDIPIFVLTGQTVNGKTDFAMERELLSRGSTVAYFTKPLEFDALLERLQVYIDLPC